MSFQLLDANFSVPFSLGRKKLMGANKSTVNWQMKIPKITLKDVLAHNGEGQ